MPAREKAPKAPQQAPLAPLFPDDLYQDFDPYLFVEEPVEPKSFRKLLTSALLWCVMIPLFIMLIVHQQTMKRTVELADQQQVDLTRMWAAAIDNELRSLQSVAASLAYTEHPAATGAVAAKTLPAHVLAIREKPKEDARTGVRTGMSITGRPNLFVTGCSDATCVELQIDPRSIGDNLWNRFSEESAVGHVLDDKGALLFTSDASFVKNFPDTSFHEHLKEGLSFWRATVTRENPQVQAAVPIAGTNLIAATEFSLTARNMAMQDSLESSGFLILFAFFASFISGILTSRPIIQSINLLGDAVDAMKKGVPIKVSETIAQFGPTELVRFATRFEDMADENRDKSQKLQELTEALEQRVKERTESLQNRNKELRALHLLLAPIEGSVQTEVDKAVANVRQIYGIDDLHFLPAGESVDPECRSVPVSLGDKTFGHLVTAKTELRGEDDPTCAAVRRLAGSIAIVLANRELLVSLRKEQDTLKGAFGSMTEGVALVSDTDQIAYANRHFRTLLGLTQSDPILFHDVISEQFASVVRLDEAGKPHPAPTEDAFLPERIYRATTRGDSPQTFEMRTFAVRSGILQKEGIGLGVLVRDVSEEMEMSRMKDRLVSIVAHELKTPITSLRLQAETLASGIGLEDKDRAQILTEMCEESIRLRKLIDDWLDLARLDEGKLLLEKKIVHIATPIDKAAKLVKTRFPIMVRRTIDADADCFRFDPARITQVFINLFSNSARYTKEDVPAEVTVDVRRVGETVEIAVEDNGIGIAPSKLPHIFERFYQADMRDRRRKGGTGLGLAIVQAIVEAHEGTIRVESREGEFTRFVIALPY